MLRSLIQNKDTDKNTTHSYLDLYEELLSSRRESAQKVLEVGIGDFKQKNGGSIKLWRDYFVSAQIYGIDILSRNRVMDELLNDPRVILFTSTNAYDPKFVETLGDQKFDFMLDDGPHTLKSMIDFITLYSPLLAEKGVLVIEDVQSMDWIPALTKSTPESLRPFIKTYDLR